MNAVHAASRTLAAAALLGVLAAAGCSVDVPPLTLGFPATVGEGQAPSVIVTLPEVLEDDVTVFIESSNPALLSAPASVVVPAGDLQVTATATAVQNAYLDFDQALTLTISAPGYENATVAFQLLDDEPRTLAVTLGSPTVTEGAATVTGTVSLAAGVLARNGLDIALAADDPDAILVPGSVHIPAGAGAEDFTVDATEDGDSVSETVTIEASHPQLLPGSEQIAVTDNDT